MLERLMCKFQTTRLLRRLGRRRHGSISPVGLHVFQQFVTPLEQKSLLASSFELIRNIDSYRRQGQSGSPVKTRTSLSKQHNLTSEEYYERIKVADGDTKVIHGQFFETYGDVGHTLTYFMNSSNIPSFVKDKIVDKLAAKPEVQDKLGKDLNWMFTFNTYSFVRGRREVPGFPFHVDSDFNGDMTAILTLMASATLEMVPVLSPDSASALKSYKVDLLPGSLVLLSGDSRWHWKHRVIPTKADDTNLSDCALKNDTGGPAFSNIRRISLVLGCRPTSPEH